MRSPAAGSDRGAMYRPQAPGFGYLQHIADNEATSAAAWRSRKQTVAELQMRNR